MSDFDQNFTNAWGRQGGENLHAPGAEDESIHAKEDSNKPQEDSSHHGENSRHQDDEVKEASHETVDTRDEPVNKGPPKGHQTNDGLWQLLDNILHRIRSHYSTRAGKHNTRQSDIKRQIMVNGSISETRDPVLIFVENEHLEIPIISDGMDDSQLFQQLGMFYRYLKVKRGLVELLVPRSLDRIDTVKVSSCISIPFESFGTNSKSRF
jgi:hypothetical protein